MVDEICPSDATNAAKNKYATVENINYEQYENSNRWYYNISWKPLNGKSRLPLNSPETRRIHLFNDGANANFNL